MNMVAGMPTQNLGPQATEPSSTSGQSEAHHGPGGQKMQNVSLNLKFTGGRMWGFNTNDRGFLMKLRLYQFFPFSIIQSWLTVCPPASGGAPAAAPQHHPRPPHPIPSQTISSQNVGS